MRMITGGFTPCNRRIDCRKVAIAAAAAFLLFAASARAGVTQFIVDPSQSFIQITAVQLLAEAGLPGYTDTPAKGQPNSITGNISGPFDTPGSTGLITNFYGGLLADIQPTSVKFLAGGGGITAIQRPASVFYPGTDANGNVSNTNPLSPADYGLYHDKIGGFEIINDFNMEISSSFAEPRSGLTNFGITPGQTKFTTKSGYDGLIESNPAFAIAPVKQTMVGLQWLLGLGLGGANTSPGQLLPGGVMVLPINALIKGSLGTGATLIHGIPVAYQMNGQIVMVAAVPEPSSMILLGFGVVGLVGCAYRARKRRALAA